MTSTDDADETAGADEQPGVDKPGADEQPGVDKPGADEQPADNEDAERTPEVPSRELPAHISQQANQAPAFRTLVRVFGGYAFSRQTVLTSVVFTVGFTVMIAIIDAVDPPVPPHDLDISVLGTFVVVGLAALVPFTCLQFGFLALAIPRSGKALGYAWTLAVPPWTVPMAVMVSAQRVMVPFGLVMMVVPALAAQADAAMLAGLAASTVLSVMLWCALGVAFTLTLKFSMIYAYVYVLVDTWVLTLLLSDTPLYHLSLIRHVASPFLSLITVSGSDEFEAGKVPDVTPVALALPVVLAVTAAALAVATWRVKHLMRKAAEAAQNPA